MRELQFWQKRIFTTASIIVVFVGGWAFGDQQKARKTAEARSYTTVVWLGEMRKNMIRMENKLTAIEARLDAEAEEQNALCDLEFGKGWDEAMDEVEMLWGVPLSCDADYESPC
jgi:hypothetical protein